MHGPREAVGGLQVKDLDKIYTIRHVVHFAAVMWRGEDRLRNALRSNITSVQEHHQIPWRNATKHTSQSQYIPFFEWGE